MAYRVVRCPECKHIITWVNDYMPVDCCKCKRTGVIEPLMTLREIKEAKRYRGSVSGLRIY